MSNEPNALGTELVINEQTLPVIEQIAEGLPGGFFIYHAHGDEDIIFVNSAMLRLVGCETAEEFKKHTGNTFPGLVHPDDIERVEAIIAEQVEAHEHNMDYVEYRVTRLDGEVRWVLDYGHFVHTDNLGDIFYVFVVDSTEERLQARELERMRTENQAKSAFLFNMSHDVRTPLNAIVGFSALARRHVDDPKRAIECLDKIDTATDYLIELIDDVLDMSLIESGTMANKEQPCHVLDQLTSVVDMLATQAEDKGLHLRFEMDAPFVASMADPLNLRRIFAEVIANAIKYTPEGGMVSVWAKGEILDEGRVSYQIKIADTGVGIDRKFLGNVFELFERENNTTVSGKAGTGLGLSITKGLVDMMDGTIDIDSVKGEGTTVTLGLSFEICEEEDLLHNVASDTFSQQDLEHLRGRRVLVVEDNELNRVITEAILKEAGLEVETVSDGTHAVSSIHCRPAGYYDLVLMDIQMPIMDGYDATRAIRGMDRADVAELPIVALSANAMEVDKRLSMESGMNAHVAKPIDVSHLIGAISAYIR